MTLPDWNVDDYLVSFDDIHFSGYVVDAPLRMKVGWVLRYLHDVIFPDAIRAIVNGGELSGLLLGFSIVEYLSGYYAGKQSQKKDFIAFVKVYFPEQYFPYIDDIYVHLRNGLVHNLTIKNPWQNSPINFILEKESPLHLVSKEEKIVFSSQHFIEDTRRAMVMFFYDLSMNADDNPELVSNFNKRFNKQNGASSMMIEVD